MAMDTFGLPNLDKPPSFGKSFGRGHSDSTGTFGATVRRGFSGPPIPEPLSTTPHKDLGLAWGNLVGDAQGVGGVIQDMLDQPFNAVSKGMLGPHRWVDGILNTGSGIPRNIILHVTGNLK